MAYLDYSPVQLTDTTEGMRRLGDSLTSAMKRKQDREQFEQKQVFEREQEQRRLSQQQQQYDYLNKIEERKNRMAEIEFNRKQQADIDARMDRARKAQTPQEAEAIVKGIVKYDPHTGKEIATGKLTPGEIPDVGPAPVAPTAPVAPAFPVKEAAGVIPDIAQALPGAPPELAAAMRGRQRAAAPPISLDNPQSDPAVEARMSAERADLAAKAPQRKGKMFVDQINDDGVATLINDDGSKVHVRAQKGWAEGQYIGPDGQPEAADSTRRFDPSVQGTRFEDNAAPDRFQAATDAFSSYQGEQQALPGKQKAYAQEMQAFPGRQNEYAAKVRNAEGRRPYTMSVGDEPGVTFDFDTQRRGARVQAAQDFVDIVGQLNLTPAQQEAAKFARVAILNGSNPDAVMKQFQAERTLGIKQDYGHAEGELNRQKDIDVAHIRADAPQMDWKERVGLGNLALNAERLGKGEFQDWLRNAGYKQEFAGLKQLIATSQQMKKHNSALDTAAGAQFARNAQGTGVLSNQDYDNFWLKIGSGEDRTEDWFERAVTGRMGDAKRQIVLKAIAEKVNNVADNIRGMASQADVKFAGEPWYPGDRQMYFGVVPDLPATGQSIGPRIGASGIPRKGAPPEHRAHLKAKGSAVDNILKREESP